MKRILLLVFALISYLNLSAQFRMVGNGSWSVIDDSTLQATVNFQPDLSGQGYLATQIADTFMLFTPTEQLFRIDSVWDHTFSSATLRVVEYGNTNGIPIGQVMVYDPAGKRTIPQVPFGSTGATAQMQAAVNTYNARVDTSPSIPANELAFGNPNNSGIMSSPKLVFTESLGKLILGDSALYNGAIEVNGASGIFTINAHWGAGWDNIIQNAGNGLNVIHLENCASCASWNYMYRGRNDGSANPLPVANGDRLGGMLMYGRDSANIWENAAEISTTITSMDATTFGNRIDIKNKSLAGAVTTRLSIEESGDVLLSGYPDTRNDYAATSPIRLFYPDANGKLQVTLPDSTQVTEPITNSGLVSLRAALRSLHNEIPALSATGIYGADGTLADNRIVHGNLKTLTFDFPSSYLINIGTGAFRIAANQAGTSSTERVAAEFSATNSAGAGSTNFGVGLEFTGEDASGLISTMGYMSWKWSTATNGNESSTFTLQNSQDGGMADMMYVLKTGQFQFPWYAGGGITGTPAYNLAIDTNGKMIATSTVAGVGDGSYVPVITMGAASDTLLTTDTLIYSRIGNTVTVSGRFEVGFGNWSATSSYQVSLPISSTFDYEGDVHGQMQVYRSNGFTGGTDYPGQHSVYADVTDHEALIRLEDWTGGSTAPWPANELWVSFQFTYRL